MTQITKNTGYAFTPTAEFIKNEILNEAVDMLIFPTQTFPQEVRDEDGRYVLDPAFIQYEADGITPVIDNEEGVYSKFGVDPENSPYFNLVPIDPNNPVWLMHDVEYLDFDALNKQTTSGMVLIPNLDATINMTNSYLIRSLAQVVYAGDSTTLFVMGSDRKTYSRTYNHLASAFDGGWQTDKQAEKDNEIMGYFSGLEMAGVKANGSPYGGFSISTSTFNAIISRASGTKVIGKSYNSTDATLPKILINRNEKSLSIWNYELQYFSTSNIPLIEYLTLVGIGATTISYLPPTIKTLRLYSNKAVPDFTLTTSLAMPLATSIKLFGFTNTTFEFGACPNLTSIELQFDINLTSIVFHSVLPNVISFVAKAGSKISGLDLTKIPNITNFDCPDNNFADVAGVPFSIAPLTKVKIVNVRDAGLSQAAVDGILAQLVARADFTGASCICALNNQPSEWNTGNGYVNAAPSAAGLINFNILSARGCLVQHA